MMHRLVPNFIIEQFVAGKLSGKFQAAALFVDISGFSALTDELMSQGQHGAEVLVTIIRAVFKPLMQSVYEQGGFVATLAGDAFTALFPIDDPQTGGYSNALAAAWMIQDRMLRVAVQDDTPDGAPSLAVKVGVAEGMIDWGIVQSEDNRRAAYYFRGGAIDDCASAEHCAAPGEVILASGFYAAVMESVYAKQVKWVSELGGYYKVAQITRPLPAPRKVNLSPVDLEATSHFHPSTLVTQSYGGEFRHVVNLFIRLPTVRTEAQLAIFMQSLFTLQDRYGGLFNRLDFGDKGSHLLLFWGAPVAHENDIERALNFVLDLQTQTSIPINAGVTYRIAHAGFVGSHLREEYTCFGKGVNLAARFMTQAARGEIWLDEAVAQRAKQHYDLDFEGAMNFKGFAEPQRVYVLIERQEDIEALPQGHLVGRQTELGQLTDFIAPLKEGRFAGVMLIVGEAGIGKSRLVHDFLTDHTSHDLENCQVFLAQADEILHSAFTPFRYWLRRYFGQSGTQSEARNKRAFNRALDRLIDLTGDKGLAGELDRTRSFLGALVNLHWPDSLYEQLEPQGRHENTFLGLLGLLQAESLQQPVIVRLEDAHWLDEASRAFLAQLVQALTADDRKSYPIALIITSRLVGREIVPGDLAYQQIHLARLADDQLDRLAQDQLGAAAVPSLLALLAERAEGNPFFAEQILRYLKGQDLLVLTPEGWSVTQMPDIALLPTDVRAVLVARLDQLAQDVKEVVQAAAVLGREFEIQLLSRMLQDNQDLPNKLDQVEKVGIWTLLNELHYIFRHALLRDAAYHMQLLAQRQKLHALAMTSLEDLYDQDLAPHAGELAYHAEQAGRVEKARIYLQQAGDAAREAYENSLAINYYSRALALVPGDDTETRCQLLLAREDVQHLLGERDSQQTDLKALIDLVEGSGDLHTQAEIALRRSRYAGAIGDHLTAIGAAQEAVEVALKSGRTAQAAQGYRYWGWYLMRQTAYEEANQRLEAGLIQAREIRNAGLEADCLNALGALALEIGDYNVASEHYRQAGVLYQQSNNKAGEARIWNNQGATASNQGQYAEAIPYYEKALEIRRQIGDRRAEGNTLYNLGGACRALGRFSRARDCYENALAITRQVGDRRGEGLALNSLGLLAANLGKFALATQYGEQSLETFEHIGDRMLISTARTNLGSYAIDRGHFEKAREHYQVCLEIAQEIERPSNEGYALWGLGEVLLHLDQPEQATDYFETARLKWQVLGWPAEVIESEAGLARAALALNDLDKAAALVEKILPALDSGALSSSDQHFLIYLTCVRVLEARGDSRTAAVLEQAHTKLQEQATNIPEINARQSFLEIPYHRQLIEVFQNLQQ